MAKLSKPGRAFFAIAMAAFGFQYLLHALFAGVPALGPPWVFAHPFWGYATAIVLVVAAASFASNVKAGCAAIVLAIVLFLRVLFVYAPALVANIHDPGPWTSGSEILVLCGVALVLAGTCSIERSDSDGRDFGQKPTVAAGRLLFAIPLVVFGVQHFMYARFVATLVPAWIPGRLFWAYLVGVAFVAAAIGIATRIMGRLAATLLGFMFLLWVFILHLPRVVAAPHAGNEWTSMFVALAMSGGAFLVAETLSGMTYGSARVSKR